MRILIGAGIHAAEDSHVDAQFAAHGLSDVANGPEPHVLLQPNVR
jgi:hypothetical protein